MSDRQIQSQKLVGFLLIAGLVGLGLYWQHSRMHTDLISLLLHHIKGAITQIKTEVCLNPIFYFFTATILGLEYIFPVHKGQKLLSVGLLQDFIWLIGAYFLKAFLLRPYLEFLVWFYNQFLKGFTINLPAKLALPEFMTLVLAILIADFLSWLAHLLQHKIKFIWRFHEIHHSQPELNLFTDGRFHFGDSSISYPLIIIPLFLLTLPVPYIGYYLLLRVWYGRLYHASIKSDFSWLKYILVTPQSHRIHHSLEPKHYDKNFGLFLSIWDYIFQTQYRKYDEYPPTGILNPNFPVEKKSQLLYLCKNFWQQLVHPFLNFRS